MTRPARLDVDGTAKPLTELRGVVSKDAAAKQLCINSNQVECYAVRPSAEAAFGIPDDYDNEDDCQAGGPGMTPDEVWELARTKWSVETFRKCLRMVRDETVEACARIAVTEQNYWREREHAGQAAAENIEHAIRKLSNT